MKKTNKKLLLNRETVRKLNQDELANGVVGGTTNPACLPKSASLSGSVPLPSLPVGDGIPEADYNIGDIGDLGYLAQMSFIC